MSARRVVWRPGPVDHIDLRCRLVDIDWVRCHNPHCSAGFDDIYVCSCGDIHVVDHDINHQHVLINERLLTDDGRPDYDDHYDDDHPAANHDDHPATNHDDDHPATNHDDDDDAATYHDYNGGGRTNAQRLDRQLLLLACDKTITVGDKVRWRNNGSGVIQTTTGPGWNSGQMGDGQTFTRTFNQVGTFSYLCTIHPTIMAGTITVES